MAWTIDDDLYVTRNTGLGIQQPQERLEVNGKIKTTDLQASGTVQAQKIEGEGAFVTGMIIMWSGDVNQIPIGWALCDGKTINGQKTPDLRGRFVVGYKDDDLSYGTLGKTGGANTVSLSINEMPSHSHIGSTSEAGNHEHWIEGTDANGLAWRKRHISGTTTVDMGFGGGGDADPNDERWRGAVNTDSQGNHTHTVTVNNTGGGQAHENCPPYYVVAYIMKI